MDKKSKKSLSDKSITALKWNYIGRFAAMLSHFVIGIILARLLGPKPFGLVTIALLVHGLRKLITEGVLSEYHNQESAYIRAEFLKNDT
jgi:O-antigen/teichoic acid export membrane protein